MAFTDPPLVRLVSDGLIRLVNNGMTEVDFGLAEGASGTITLDEATVPGEVVLLPAFRPRTYENSAGQKISLQDSVQVEIVFTGQQTVSQPVRVVKTGTTPLDFLITLTNDSNSELSAVEFEVYIRFH
jgi:hypothetical protein